MLKIPKDLNQRLKDGGVGWGGGGGGGGAGGRGVGNSRLPKSAFPKVYSEEYLFDQVTP